LLINIDNVIENDVHSFMESAAESNNIARRTEARPRHYADDEPVALRRLACGQCA
jgi:hypothetical protein